MSRVCLSLTSAAANRSADRSILGRAATWLLLALASSGLLLSTGSERSSAFAQEPVKVLFVTQSKGFTHGSVNRQGKELAPAEIAMTQLGQQTGLFTVNSTQDCEADFTKANLKKYQIVMFYTTGELPIAAADREYFFKEWLPAKGHGVVGFHSAADTFGDYELYWDMIGGTFDGHPWNSGDTVTITVHDPKHPAMKPFGNEFTFKDEIYQYKHWQPEKVRVLMSLNMEKTAIKKPYHVPVSWVKKYGDGRVFFTNLGHNESTWTDKQFQEHVLGGVEWVLGKQAGDATPNPEVSKAQHEKSIKDAEGK
jgi:uncharacterized protein